ncbi:hypothetical protein A2U01_0105987, partial [Trifolium medium]|nr:hypothetical protein [Trifolium medium]
VHELEQEMEQGWHQYHGVAYPGDIEDGELADSEDDSEDDEREILSEE